MKRNTLILIALVTIFALALSACGGAKPAATEEPAAPTQETAATEPAATEPTAAAENPADSGATDVVVTDLVGYDDGYGSFYIEGVVYNGTDSAVENITVTVAAKDASGASLLVDDDGNPAESYDTYTNGYYLGAGEATIFMYILDIPNGAPAEYDAVVTGYDASDIEAVTVNVVNDYGYDMGDGTAYVSGELGNTGSSPITVNSVAVAIYDADGNLIGVSSTGNYASYLAESGNEGGMDTTPFATSVYIAPNTTPTDYEVFATGTVTSKAASPIQIDVANTYIDEYGDVHIVGTATNTADVAYTSLVVGGLYDSEGVVLDADYTFLGIPVRPGQAVPFDLDWFGSVNSDADILANVSNTSVQADLYYTNEAYITLSDVDAGTPTVEKSGSTWTISGIASNSGSSDLDDMVVFARVLDAEGNLVAFGMTTVYPEDVDSFAAAATGAYTITIYLEASADASAYTVEVSAYGEVY